MKKKKLKKPIAYQEGTVSYEDLTYHRVLYPGHYGAFLGFQETSESTIFLCTCSKEAIENYISFRLSTKIYSTADPTHRFILASSSFPLSLIKNFLAKGVRSDGTVIKYLNFKHRICHECNCIVPKYRYCHEMYGGLFKQTYGWYINKQAYEYGIEPVWDRILLMVCPQEIQALIEIQLEEYHEQLRKLSNENNEQANDLSKKYRKQQRRVWEIIENEVRRKFGFKKIGEAWTSETVLYYMIQELFPNEKILRHYRPVFFEGLELDIYLPNLMIGIEYQGQQHFKAFDHWGGEKTFLKTQERDKRKKRICTKKNIKFSIFHL